MLVFGTTAYPVVPGLGGVLLKTSKVFLILLSLMAVQSSHAELQQGQAEVPTIQVTSRLVFLDVTVLDSSGHPIVTGLNKTDFAITEDKRPQPIFSFERPDGHFEAPAANIFVLDFLNSSFENFAYIRSSVKRYLAAQPERLAAPTELMVVGNKSLEMLQGFTQSKEELLFALEHLSAAVEFGNLAWPTSAVCFGPPLGTLMLRELGSAGA